MGPLVSTQSLVTAPVADVQLVKSACEPSPSGETTWTDCSVATRSASPTATLLAPTSFCETEQLVLAGAPEVGVHDDHLLAGERQRHGEVGDRDALALALQAAGDEQRLGGAVDVHEGEVGAQQTERLGDGVGGVLEGHQ